MSGEVYTIGHSDHKIESFIDHILRHGINALADVRSSPYSRIQPQFNRESLKQALQQHKISYVFLGKELGARSEQSECYKNGKVQFDVLAKQPLFLQGLNRIIKGMEKHRIALMCAERDPLNCHRTILVSRQLHNRGIAIKHILYDGSVESHSTVEMRLLENLKMEEGDLFLSQTEILSNAYTKWGERIAYVAESSDNDEWRNK